MMTSISFFYSTLRVEGSKDDLLSINHIKLYQTINDSCSINISSIIRFFLEKVISFFKFLNVFVNLLPY